MKVGYLGPCGSYSYEAACRYSSKIAKESEYVALTSFAAIIDGVELGNLELGIIPVENSTHGAVATAMDRLLYLKKGIVCGEVIVNIDHCLLSLAANSDDIKIIYSHEQALEQCRNFFVSRYPHMEFMSCSSTTQACELASEGGAAFGAIASKLAANLYGLPIMEQNIQDNAYNQTRFLIIGTKQAPLTGNDKTSIVFAFPGDYPGSLYNILKAFARRNINLTRIESRPAKNLMGKYIFHVDFIGNCQDEKGTSVLYEIKSHVSWLKILGSYPVDTGTSKGQKEDTQCYVI